ncbi:unnamed protein product [Jaminaea pallidilutea]
MPHAAMSSHHVQTPFHDLYEVFSTHSRSLQLLVRTPHGLYSSSFSHHTVSTARPTSRRHTVLTVYSLYGSRSLLRTSPSPILAPALLTLHGIMIERHDVVTASARRAQGP